MLLAMMRVQQWCKLTSCQDDCASLRLYLCWQKMLTCSPQMLLKDIKYISETIVKTTHQTHCRGRQAGVATTGVARHGQVVGRCECRQVQAWGHRCKKKNKKKQRSRQAWVVTGRGAAR